MIKSGSESMPYPSYPALIAENVQDLTHHRAQAIFICDNEDALVTAG